MLDKVKNFPKVLSDNSNPITKIFGGLLKKIESSTGIMIEGYVTLLLEEKKAVLEAKKTIIDEISTDESIDPIERYALVSYTKKFAKEYKNQAEIVFRSGKYLKKEAQPGNLDDDWLFDFMDKAGKISTEEMQEIWARILAQEVNQPLSISKKLVRIVYEISTEEAATFMNLVPFCVDAYEDGKLVDTYPVFVERGDNSNTKYGISYQNLIDIEAIGLINLDLESNLGHTWKNVCAEFKYGDKTITYRDPNGYLILGSILFTKAGSELLKICTRTYDEERYTYICNTIEFLNNPKNRLV